MQVLNGTADLTELNISPYTPPLVSTSAIKTILPWIPIDAIQRDDEGLSEVTKVHFKNFAIQMIPESV